MVLGNLKKKKLTIKWPDNCSLKDWIVKFHAEACLNCSSLVFTVNLFRKMTIFMFLTIIDVLATTEFYGSYH